METNNDRRLPVGIIAARQEVDRKVYVDITKTNRLIITTHVVNNEFMRAFPSRRWDQGKRAWIAPITRSNIAYMQESNIWQQDLFRFTPEAVVALRTARDRLSELDNVGRSNIKSFPTNYPFKREPRDRQLEALNKVYHLPQFALFMDMRTGKSKVIIDTIACRRMDDLVRRVVIVCPRTIRGNWKNEFSIDCPLATDIYLLESDQIKAFDVWDATPHDLKVLIVAAETLSGSKNALDMCTRFVMKSTKSMMVIDESTVIKNPKSLRFKRCDTIGKACEYKVIATGTPTGLGPEDLYAQFQFLNPDIIGIGDFTSFKHRYCEMGGFQNKKVVGYKDLDDLMSLIEPFIYQARKSEVFPDDPPTVYMVRKVNMTNKQKKIYNDIKNDGRSLVDGEYLVVENVLEKFLRLQEITGGHIAIPDSWNEGDGRIRDYRKLAIDTVNPKLDEVLAVIEELGEDQSYIIWCAFKPELYMVAQALRIKYGDDSVVEIHGDISEEQKNINVFQLFQPKLARFLVGNTQSAGMGLTLSAADVEIYMSNTHRFIDRQQSEERAFASGKPNPTLVVDIICDKTVDVHVLQSMKVKRDLSEYVRQSISDIKQLGSVLEGDESAVNLDTIDNSSLF